MNTKFLESRHEGREYLGHRGVGCRITMKSILKEECVNVWTGFIWLGIRSSGGLF
jgi:hypothetical protein